MHNVGGFYVERKKNNINNRETKKVNSCQIRDLSNVHTGTSCSHINRSLSNALKTFAMLLIFRLWLSTSLFVFSTSFAF